MPELTLFLCGDVMTGRGIDQVLPHPVDPILYEPYIRDARDYVALAEKANGPIPSPVGFDYVWGDAREALRRAAPHARIVNLETSITTHPVPWPGKPIQYRMNPSHFEVLHAAQIDCCVLANNHVLDWERDGLGQTLAVLHSAGIKTAGAGLDAAQAQRPAVLETTAGRVLVYACGHGSSGIPPEWSAGTSRSGVNRLPDLSTATARRIAEQCRAVRQPGDRLVVSVHWGGNWGYAVPAEQIAFAHALIDVADADLVHGHSSHHPKGIEVYRNRLVLYGCGDLINDYEGIGGYEAFRGELALLYLPRLGVRGELLTLRMVPVRTRRFRLQRASEEEAGWLRQTLHREGARFNTTVSLQDDGSLVLAWSASGNSA